MEPLIAVALMTLMGLALASMGAGSMLLLEPKGAALRSLAYTLIKVAVLLFGIMLMFL